MNTAVLPVATFESQIEIVSKVLGSLARVWKECLWTICIRCLAVIEQDEDAIATISDRDNSNDETYVQAVTVVNDDMVELEYDDLIKKFNEIHNITGHKIGLLLWRS
jgi:hypothetical protein